MAAKCAGIYITAEARGRRAGAVTCDAASLIKPVLVPPNQHCSQVLKREREKGELGQ